MSLLAVLFVTELWAAPSGGAEEHAASISQLLFPLINFVIFLYLIKRFALPVARDYFKLRRQEIAAAVREADDAQQRAQAIVGEYKNRLARLDAEARELREALRVEGERKKAKLLAEAEILVTRIKTDADFLAQQEVKSARQGLRSEIARVAKAAAEKMVLNHLTAADQKRMVSEFLSEVGEGR